MRERKRSVEERSLGGRERFYKDEDGNLRRVPPRVARGWVDADALIEAVREAHDDKLPHDGATHMYSTEVAIARRTTPSSGYVDIHPTVASETE